MPVLMKIKSAYASLPTAERKVADFILKNPKKAPLMVINEIAGEVGVSVPSVTRLAKKLGYEGFLDFRVALAQGGATLDVATAAPIQETDTDEKVITKIFMASCSAIEDSLKALDKRALSALAEAVVKGKRIFIFGTASSAALAFDLAKQLVFLGYDAISVNDSMTMEMYGKHFSVEDVVIGITRSGRSKTISEALKIAKQSGSKTALVTNYVNAVPVNYADHFFCTSRIDDVKRIVGRETNISMHAWATALVTLAAIKTVER